MTKSLNAKTGRELHSAVTDVASHGTSKMRTIAQFAADDTQAFVRMSSREICEQLDTSEPTLIRFCRQFGHAGIADFRIELALAMAAHQPNLSFVPQAIDRRSVNQAEKRLIADAAIDLVEDDKSLLIDNGSTAEVFASILERTSPKTIMTNGLMVAQNAMLGGKHRVMLTGGDIIPQTSSLGGRLVEHSISDMHFDTFIMGADSFHPPHGISTYSEAEAHITRAMLKQAARVIVLADHTKFRRPGLHWICGAHQVQILVTDRPLDPAISERLEELNVQVVTAALHSSDHIEKKIAQ